MHIKNLLILVVALTASACLAAEELIGTAIQANGEAVPYILSANNSTPSYVVILFPGGTGVMNPRMEDGKLTYAFRGNFVIKTRPLLVDNEFAAVATNSTQVAERVQAILDDLKRRFPDAQVYLMGTSNGTHDTMALADYLSTRIAGEIHTSSKLGIGSFDARKYRNRHLVVHHRNDTCRFTPFAAAEASHKNFGNDFIAMEGGFGVGDPCEPQAHHGFNGIEGATIDAIKAWIRQGGKATATRPDPR